MCAPGVPRQGTFIFAFKGIPRCIMQGDKILRKRGREMKILVCVGFSSFCPRSKDRRDATYRLYRCFIEESCFNPRIDGGVYNDSKCRGLWDQTGILNSRITKSLRRAKFEGCFFRNILADVLINPFKL